MRVIAGTLGGRTLRAPRGQTTRPTADRVRQALFSMLGDVADANVLDLYAGSGALGIEALSRGARHATFVESSRPALEVIRENLRTLGIGEQASVLGLRVELSARALGARGPFDLVLCDPPWPDLTRALASVGRLVPALLAEAGRLVVEHPARAEVELPGLTRYDRRRWGDSGVSLFSRD